MALIPAVGRRSLRSRLILTGLYLVLTLCAVTTVYPFVLMLSESVTSDYDQARYDIVPRYLTSLPPLFGKYAEEKFDGNIDLINGSYNSRYINVQGVDPPAYADPSEAALWNAFAKALPEKYKTAGFAGTSQAYSPSRLLDRYRLWLTNRFHGDIHALNVAYTEEDPSFYVVFPPFEQPRTHNWAPDSTVKSADWAQFESTLPQSWFIIDLSDPLYDRWLREESGYADVNALNQAWGTTYKDFRDIPLSEAPEGNQTEQSTWLTFVRTKLPYRYTVVAPGALGSYTAFLTQHYHGRIADYNRLYGAQVRSFSEVPLPSPDFIPATGPPLLDWIAFLNVVPSKYLTADTVETRFRAMEAKRLNLSPQAAGVLPVPAEAADWAYVRAHAGELRWIYVTRNYALALGYMALHGSALVNTLLYCSLAVLTALTINPLCAYALSRYNLSYGNTVLLYLLATMAFPGEVTMIPNFLLLKQLGLLNTFAALVLPGAASGYSVFLLKGFFDSLPRELYEAATIDGASEARMFFTITLPIAKPIFAVLGLYAFTGAYTAFLFALIVCQNQHIWTMMVWLYEMQASGAPDYVMLAAMTLSSVPLLLIFLFAQRTIMRGIILPSFK